MAFASVRPLNAETRVSAISAEEPPRLAIAAAMRVWQERRSHVRTDPVVWPANMLGQAAGEYPVNGHYNKDLQDPERAAVLVRALADAMTEIRWDSSRTYWDNEEKRLMAYPVPTLRSFICEPKSGELDGLLAGEVATMADQVFRNSGSNFVVQKKVGRWSFDSTQITRDNYIQAFCEMCAYLCSCDLVLIEHPATTFTRRMGASGYGSTNAEAAAMAQGGILNGLSNGTVLLSEPGVRMRNEYKLQGSKAVYSSNIGWAEGSYKIDGSVHPGRFVPYSIAFPIRTNVGSFDPFLEGAWGTSNFTTSYHRLLDEGWVEDGKNYDSPLFTPPSFEHLSILHMPSAPSVDQVAEYSLALHMYSMHYPDWVYSLDSLLEACDEECGSCASGLIFTTDVSSVDIKIGLGRGADGPYGSLVIKADKPTAYLSSPRGLQRRTSRGVASIVDYTQRYDANVATDPDRISYINRPLRQMYTPDWVLNVVQKGSSAYSLSFYHRSEVKDRSAKSGTFDISSATPYMTYLIESPEGDINRLEASEISRDGTVRKHVYQYNSATDGWSLKKGAGADAHVESVQWRTEGTDRIERRIITGGDGVVLSVVDKRYHVYPWNDPTSVVPSLRRELVEEVNDPEGAALRTVYSYYDDKGMDSVNYAHRKSVVRADGSWERYSYNSRGALEKTVTPHQDSRIDDPDDSSRCEIVRYAEIGDLDGDSIPEHLQTKLTTLQGREIRRGYDVIYSKAESNEQGIVSRRVHVDAVSTGASWTAPGGLVTEERFYQQGLDAGKLHSVRNPDGTFELTRYLHHTGSVEVVTDSGVPNESFSAVVDGMRRRMVTNAQNVTQLEQVSDISSGLVLSSKETLPDEFDSFGRALKVHWLDGSTEAYSYNCCGLETYTDRSGAETVYSYDSLKRRVSSLVGGISSQLILDGLGRTREEWLVGSDGVKIRKGAYDYDVAGRLMKTTDAGNNVIQYSEGFAASGRRRQIQLNPDRSEQVVEYYRDGSIASQSGSGVHPVQCASFVEQDASGAFHAVVSRVNRPDAKGGISEWEKTYSDMLGRTYKVQVPGFDGASVVEAVSVFNSKGQLERKSDLDGNFMLFTYDSRGRIFEVVADLNGNLVIDYTGPDRISRTTYSVLDDAEHGIVERTEVGQYQTQDSRDVVTVSKSDTSARLLTSWQDSQGRINKVQQKYLGGGKSVQVSVSPDMTVDTQELIDGRVAVRSIVSESGHVLSKKTYRYDSLGRLSTETDARNGDMVYAYYPNGMLQSVTAPSADGVQAPQITSYYYDSMGRLRRTVEPDKGEVFRDYYPTGELQREYGVRRYPVEYFYDNQGRMVGLKTKQDSASAKGDALTSWTFNSMRGVLESKTYADGSSVRYSYTPGGKMKTRTWARGVTTSYAYLPGTSDLQEISYSDGTASVVYSYDRAGRVAGVSAGATSSVFAYEAGLLATESLNSGPLADFQLGRSYDSGHLSGVSLRAGAAVLHSVAYSYRDEAGKRMPLLVEVVSGDKQFAYSYLPNSALSSRVRSANNGRVGMVVDMLTDKLGRLTSRVARDASGLEFGAVGYEYDEANQRRRMNVDSGEYWTFSYDKLGQLQKSEKFRPSGQAVPGYSFAYRFDDIGNRKAEAINGREALYKANVLNQYEWRDVPGAIDVLGEGLPNAELTVNGRATVRTEKGAALSYFYIPYSTDTVGPVALDVQSRVAGTMEYTLDEHRVAYQSTAKESFSHDLDGNLTHDWRWDYTWDGENRLSAMETSAGAAAVGVPRQRLEFGYDFMGRRVSKKTSEWNGASASWVVKSELAFAYDGWNLLAEFSVVSGVPTLSQAHVWGTDLSGQLQGAGGVGGLLSSTVGGANYFPIYDGNGNIMKWVDASSWAVCSSQEYDPFGRVIKSVGSASQLFRFGFSTKYTDRESGLCYYGLRYYSPSTGRWINRDPIQERGGVNLYGMVGNDPLNKVDYLGLLLVGVDGTGSKKWVKPRDDGYTNSSVFNFVKDTSGPTLYLGGPALLGFDVKGIADEAMKFIAEELKKNPSEPINIVGHSRGGLIAIELAKRLKKGIPCINNGKPIRVNFIGLYDAVDRAIGVDGSEIPDNVNSVAHAVRDDKAGSRRSFGHTGRSSENPNAYDEQVFYGTHSGLGGDPGNGDEPMDYIDMHDGTVVAEPKVPLAQDYDAYIAADKYIRQRARAAGVNIR